MAHSLPFRLSMQVPANVWDRDTSEHEFFCRWQTLLPLPSSLRREITFRHVAGVTSWSFLKAANCSAGEASSNLLLLDWGSIFLLAKMATGTSVIMVGFSCIYMFQTVHVCFLIGCRFKRCYKVYLMQRWVTINFRTYPYGLFFSFWTSAHDGCIELLSLGFLFFVFILLGWYVRSFSVA